MNLRLTIEGSASQLAMILANLPDGVAVGAAAPTQPVPMPVPAAQPAPVAQPMPQPVPPMPVGQPADDADDDASGGVAVGAVDSSGLPWDERIHASTKTTKADGTWTGRRGAPKGAEYDAIVAELRARVAQPMPVMQPAPQPVAQPAPVMPQPVPMPMAQPIPPMPANPNGAPLAAAPMPVAQPVATAFPVADAAPVYSPPPMPEMAPQPVAQPMPQPAPEPIQTAVAVATGALDFAQFMQHLSGQMTKRDAAGAPLVHADYLASITAEISTAFQLPTPLTAITDIASDPNKINYAMQLMQRDGRW